MSGGVTEDRLHRLIVWLRPLLELRLLLAVLLLGTLAWTFIELAEEVVEGDTRAIDEALLLGLRTAADPAVPIGPEWLQVVMRDITALGGYTILFLVTAATVIYLFLVGRPRTAVFILVAVLGATLLTVLLKLGFARPRPDLVPHAMRTASASFPSGHSSGAAAVYLTLGAILASFQDRRRVKLFIMGLAVVVTMLVGISRLYLGVHWPSDIIAGWALGAGWAVLCWVVAAYLRRARVLHSPPAG